MSQTVILAENPLEPSSWTQHEVEDIREFLMAHFKVWPQTARIYHRYVALKCDVTPVDEPGILRLSQLDGPFYVVVYPGNPAMVVAIIAVVVAILAAVMFRPEVPNTMDRNPNTPSPNNGLSDRQNSQRIGGRIPDIFGTVRSTPDLLAVPYSTYVSFQEVEHCFMSVGRGYYEISDIRDGDTLASAVDGTSVEFYSPNTSPVGGAPQLSIGPAITDALLAVKRSTAVNGQVLGPRARYYRSEGVQAFNNTHVINFDGGSSEDLTVLYQVGQRITLTFNTGGGEVWAPNLNGTYTIGAVTAHTITLSNPAADNAIWDTDWKVYNASYPGDHYQHFSSVGLTQFLGAWVEAVDYLWTGPFTVGDEHTSLLLLNFVAMNGMYKDDGSNQYATSVTLEASVTPLDGNDQPITSATPTQVVFNGSAIDRTTRGVTLQIPVIPVHPSVVPAWSLAADYVVGDYVSYGGLIYYAKKSNTNQSPAGGLPNWALSSTLTTASKYSVRVRRVTQQVVGFGGQVVDEVKWRDLIAAADGMRDKDGVRISNFGNVTTVRTSTPATEGALAVKERKLNLLATRRVPVWIPPSPSAFVLNQAYPASSVVTYGGHYYHNLADVDGHALPGAVGSGWFDLGASGTSGVFSTALVPTNRADDVLTFLCKDPYIGRRSDAELDTANFRQTVSDVVSYFGTTRVGEFCYTFDQPNVSFEETVASVAAAVFCRAYRRGSQIKLTFEKATTDSVLLFNHRNKLPGSEVRTVTFGMGSDNDGVEYQFVDPTDDALVTYYLPESQQALNALKVDSVGIRNKLQAYLQAHRSWNKMQYQHVQVEFEATEESELLLLGDRILVADNTRPDVWDGDVMEQNVLELTISQRVTLTVGTSWVIFLQHADGSVESIPVTQGSASNKVLLGHAPSSPLAIRDGDNDLEVRSLYWITKAVTTRETAFLVTEREPKSSFTSQVRGVNYDARYYGNDTDYKNGVVNINGELI